MEKTEALYEGLKKMLNYLPMIYNQQQLSTTNTGEIIIKYPYESIPDNAILFVLPLYSSIDTGNKLTIKFAKVSQNGLSINYSSTKTYNIFVEDTNGTKRKAGLGDIIANRLCMFRFITNNSSDIILCNNPVYNNLKCSTLCITNEAKFYEVPKVIYNDKGTEKEMPVALQQDLQNLETRLTVLENKFKFGTETAEEYFNNNPNVPKGTIYIQVEE
jgi:hypothetical protein